MRKRGFQMVKESCVKTCRVSPERVFLNQVENNVDPR